MGQLGYCAWLKVGGRADINEVLAFAITNPLDGLIP
jgi:hypothetical protein